MFFCLHVITHVKFARGKSNLFSTVDAAAVFVVIVVILLTVTSSDAPHAAGSSQTIVGSAVVACWMDRSQSTSYHITSYHVIRSCDARRQKSVETSNADTLKHTCSWEPKEKWCPSFQIFEGIVSYENETYTRHSQGQPPDQVKEGGGGGPSLSLCPFPHPATPPSSFSLLSLSLTHNLRLPWSIPPLS